MAWHEQGLYQTNAGGLLAELLGLLFRLFGDLPLKLLNTLWPQPRPVWAWLPLTLIFFAAIIFVLALLPVRGAPPQRRAGNTTQKH